MCSYQVECGFPNTFSQTPSDQLMVRLYCLARSDACEIAKRLVQGKPVPAGACPDGNVKG